MLRWDGIPSSDGTRVAHFDKNQQLWVYDIAAKTNKRIAECGEGDFADVTWSPDGKWLAYTAPDRNQMTRLYLYSPDADRITPVTTDRYDSYSPAWSPDGKWLYFLSDRTFVSAVQARGDRASRSRSSTSRPRSISCSMKPGERSPFQPDDELSPPAGGREARSTEADEKKDEQEGRRAPTPRRRQRRKACHRPHLSSPISPAFKHDCSKCRCQRAITAIYRTTASACISCRATSRRRRGRTLKTLAIENKSPKPETFADEVASYELTLDRKKLMVAQGTGHFHLRRRRQGADRHLEEAR